MGFDELDDVYARLKRAAAAFVNFLVQQVADQRPTRMPVTFALATLLLREHNRCCNEMAPAWNADTDEVWQHEELCLLFTLKMSMLQPAEVYAVTVTEVQPLVTLYLAGQKTNSLFRFLVSYLPGWEVEVGAGMAIQPEAPSAMNIAKTRNTI